MSKQITYTIILALLIVSSLVLILTDHPVWAGVFLVLCVTAEAVKD